MSIANKINDLNDKQAKKIQTKIKETPVSIRLNSIDKQRFYELRKNVLDILYTEDERLNYRTLPLEVSNSNLIRILIALGIQSSEKELKKAMSMIL